MWPLLMEEGRRSNAARMQPICTCADITQVKNSSRTIRVIRVATRNGNWKKQQSFLYTIYLDVC